MEKSLIRRVRQNKLYMPVLFLLVVMLLVVIFWPKQDFTEHRLVDTGLDNNVNFGWVDGSYLYTYNGLAFFRADIQNAFDIDVLHFSEKLPQINKIHWAGPEGVLVNFTGSFGFTQVERELNRRGFDVDTRTRNFTWFLDFDNGELALVNELPVKLDLATYSNNGNGVYYIPDYSGFAHLEDSAFTGDETPLHFYDIETGQDETITEDLELVDISSIDLCAGSETSVCVLGRDRDDISQKTLFTAEKGVGRQPLINTYGSFFPTNRPDLFLEVFADKPEVNEDDHEFVDFNEETVRLHNISDSSVTRLRFDAVISNVISDFQNTGEFYVLYDSLNEPAVYRSGRISDRGRAKSKQLPLRFIDGSEFNENIIDSSGYSSDGDVLLTTSSNRQLIFTSKTHISLPPAPGRLEVDEAVSGCVESHSEGSHYNDTNKSYRVFFMDNARFSTNIKSFGNCVAANNPSILLDYNFQFDALDPFSGRIISN